MWPPELCFLGCGAAAATHARVLRRIAPATRLSFASRDLERAREASRRHGGMAALGGYEQALAREQVGAVVITTPPAGHRDLALAALAAGKHVVVEKPAFPRPEDFDEVRAAAGRAGRLVCVAENYAYRPATVRVRDLLAGGAVGEVLLVAVNALKHQEPTGWRADPAQVGGGPLLEGGVHWLSLLASLGLEVEELAARPMAGGEDSTIITLGYAGGAAGVLAFSWGAHAPLRGVRLSRVFGTAGGIGFESNGTVVVSWGRRPTTMVADPRRASGHADMWRELLTALSGLEEPSYTLAMGRRDVELVHRAYGAAGAR